MLKVYGNYLLGAQSTAVFRGNGSSTTHVTLRKTPRPLCPEGRVSQGCCWACAASGSALVSVNNTGAGPTWEVLVGQFLVHNSRKAVLLQNQDSGATLMASVEFAVGNQSTVLEVDPSTGVVAPVWDDARERALL